MKMENLIPGQWYYIAVPEWNLSEFFMFVKHQHDKNVPNPNKFIIQTTHGTIISAPYNQNSIRIIQELTDEKKLELL